MEEAIQFARDRGDFDNATVLQLRSAIPGWMSQLSDSKGVAEFEAEYQATLSPALRTYFEQPNLAAVLEAGSDFDVFLNQLASFSNADPPFVLYHERLPHLVLAFHVHSGGVYAADLSAPETVMRFGEMDLTNFDLHVWEESAINFDQWIQESIRTARVDQIHSKSRSFPVRRD